MKKDQQVEKLKVESNIKYVREKITTIYRPSRKMMGMADRVI